MAGISHAPWVNRVSRTDYFESKVIDFYPLPARARKGTGNRGDFTFAIHCKSAKAGCRPRQTLQKQPLWQAVHAALLCILLAPGLLWAGIHQANPPRRVLADPEPWGAEDAVSEDDSPRIPEPMVFDLMRPLGAHAGEREVNVLGLFPIGVKQQDPDALPDALGLPGSHIEWAPEFELAILDGLALELELPFQDGTVAAYKGGAQWTLGRALNNTFIHGFQLIVQYDRFPSAWLPTLTYLTGLRINRTWSLLAMTGLRGNTARSTKDSVEGILNLSTFADIAPELTLGLESNLALAASGEFSLLLMPQIHWEATDHVMVQVGFGARIENGHGAVEAGMRLIRSF